MKRKCDRCGRPATHHSVEVINGQKIEKHLCDTHAAEEGLAVKTVKAPIHELLGSFVKMHAAVGGPEASCPECGTSFHRFRQTSLLGCPACYRAFSGLLTPLLERAHQGASQHVGKIPQHTGTHEHRRVSLMRMRRELDEAVTREDFELAARLRDDIERLDHAPDTPCPGEDGGGIGGEGGGGGA